MPDARIAPNDGLSHVIGGQAPPLVDLTIPEFLAATAARHGDREAAVFSAANERWTWDQLRRRADRLAAGLLGLGLYKGDRIGIWSPNRPEWLITQFATARIGLVLVNINPAYRRHELEYALNKVGAKALVTARQFKSSDYIAMLRDLAPELDGATPGRLRAERLPELASVIQLGQDPVPGTWTFAEVMDRGGGANRARLDAISRTLRPDDAINIQFTSGTTGAPKGATLTHRNIVNNARFVAAAMDLSRGRPAGIPVPFYHCFGMVLGTLVRHRRRHDGVPRRGLRPARHLLEALAAERCTACMACPPCSPPCSIIRAFAEFDLKSLRTGIMAGAPCPMELMKRVVAEMHVAQITIGYGMTETSPVSFQSDTDDRLELRTGDGRAHPPPRRGEGRRRSWPHRAGGRDRASC
jgi:fatty-acyl-CoA synthase